MGDTNIARQRANHDNHDNSHIRLCHWCQDGIIIEGKSTRDIRHFDCGCDKRANNKNMFIAARIHEPETILCAIAYDEYGDALVADPSLVMCRKQAEELGTKFTIRTGQCEKVHGAKGVYYRPISLI